MNKLYLVAISTNKKVRTKEVRLKLEVDGDQIIAPVMEIDLDKDDPSLIIEEIIANIEQSEDADLWFNKA